jgi:DNA primase
MEGYNLKAIFCFGRLYMLDLQRHECRFVKDRVLPCKRCSFGVQKVAFYNAKGHLLQSAWLMPVFLFAVLLLA